MKQTDTKEHDAIRIAIGELFSIEGDSEICKITLLFPTNEVAKLSPIKQGDIFGLENISNKK